MTYIIVAAFVAALVALILQYKRDLMMFQQNSYRADRYRRWMSQSGESTHMPRLMAWGVFLIALLPQLSVLASALIVIACSLINMWILLKEKYKKPLVVTNRVRRIWGVSLGLSFAICALACLIWLASGFDAWCLISSIALVVLFAGSYAIILLANWLLKPVEKSINKRYYDEAASILASMPDLKVIGVTGSYGKTSTKHYLNRILSEEFEVMMTPGNFNTTLGVVRSVREYMKSYTQVFIAEMGAKQPRDIKEICDLVHPAIGIITAVGPMHLESFKTIENVQATKFELADSLPADGLAVVNNDFEYIANRPVENVKCARYSVDASKGADYYASDVRYTPSGTTFAICQSDGSEVIRLATKLVGSCNVSNLIAAVTVALHLGMDKEKIKYAVERIEQVEHRLSMKRTAGGITIIDDAYNSNPIGSAMALEVLASMTSGKRIVITPGMIELGDDQEALNRKLGEEIAKSADVAFVVGEYNREAIVDGLKAGGMPEDGIRISDTFAQAQSAMLAMAKPGDTVLYENDLPDTFK